ncbi:MAG: CopD family protein, partial [Pseudomonadota bacterium]
MEIDLWGAAGVPVKLALYAASFLSAGAALFLVVYGERSGVLRAGLTRTVVIGAIVAAAASVAFIAIQAGMLAGAGIAGMADPAMMSLLWGTQAGDAIILRLVGLALLIVSVATPRPLFTVLTTIGAIAVATSFALVGHAKDAGGLWLQGLITLHLLAVAFWIGALWPLRAAARGRLELGHASELAECFGRLAAWAVPGLAVAGAITAATLLKTPSAIFEGAYGLVLTLKVAAFLALLSLAALNKLR